MFPKKNSVMALNTKFEGECASTTKITAASCRCIGINATAAAAGAEKWYNNITLLSQIPNKRFYNNNRVATAYYWSIISHYTKGLNS